MLGLFDAEHRDWSLDAMVERTGLTRMTGYRTARTLVSEGYLLFDRITGRYSLGPPMLTGIYLTETYDQFTTMARPYLESLA
jgi:DNA-binding IclR family transcriptional regulator